MPLPRLLYDGDCRFCSSCVMWAQAHIRPMLAFAPWQWSDLKSLGTTKQRAIYEVLFVAPDHQVFGGAHAVAQLLRTATGIWPVIGWLLGLIPFRWPAHWLYRLVANNRQHLPGGTPTCATPKP